MAEYISTAPWRGLVLKQLDIPQGAVAHGHPMLEQRKSLRRKEWQRNGYVLTVTPPTPKKTQTQRASQSDESSVEGRTLKEWERRC